MHSWGLGMATSNDRALFVQQRGQGRPVLLLNGLGAHHMMWAPLLRELEGATIVFDWPGLGKSPAPPLRSHTIDAFVRIVETLLEELQHAEVDVVGYSFGGIVAQHLAAARPDLVRRLVLVATSTGGGAAFGRPLAMAALSTPLRYYSKSYLALTSRFTSGPTEREPKFLRHSAQLRQAHRPDVLAYYGQLIAANTSSSLRRLPAITQPTLVVHGSDDPIIPAANSYLLASRIPEARLLITEREGHLLLHREAGRAVVAINDFLMAREHRTSEPWRTGRAVTMAEAKRALQSADLRAAQPGGAMHVLVRRILSG
jgi:poly(3-hydroxyoctanoate) depolymerase